MLEHNLYYQIILILPIIYIILRYNTDHYYGIPMHERFGFGSRTRDMRCQGTKLLQGTNDKNRMPGGLGTIISIVQGSVNFRIQ